MSQDELNTFSPDVPEIVHAVLIQAARLHSLGAISARHFKANLKRLVSEELLPRGLSVVVQRTSPGHSRFILKEQDGTVRQTFEC
jgi:hypothetical protein